MNAPDICIYHANCDDGFAAAYAVWKRFGDDVQFVACQYGSDAPDVSGKDVLIVDFSFKKLEMLKLAEQAKRIIVLDHHKTAETELADFLQLNCKGAPLEKCWADRVTSGIAVHFDMEKSGARLAWEYCFGHTPMPDWFAAIEDRDLWRFNLPDTKEICISIRSYPREFTVWEGFERNALARDGKIIQRYVDRIVGNICETAFIENIGGYDVPVAACSYDFVSETGNRLLIEFPDAPFAACVVRSFNGLTYSLRSTDDRLDVSEIAKRQGGGGHRNAAGFRRTAIVARVNERGSIVNDKENRKC
jgi:oligoribonuclease NrnB/cAMP/cGMP phosphodiesterase (DHH superfamily)